MAKKLFLGILFIGLMIITIGCNNSNTGTPPTSPDRSSAITASDGQLNPNTQAAALGKGINMGNMLESERGGWSIEICEEFFEIVKTKGFQSVRVPIRWSDYTAKTAPYTIEGPFFAKVDKVVEWGLSRNLNVIINVHHYEEIFENPDAHKERFIAIWKQIVTRYKDKSDKLYFELLNEPHNNLTIQKWNGILRDTLWEIRRIDNHHTVIISGADWGGAHGLNGLVIPAEETNAIVTFHFYSPLFFTHQGASWSGPDYATTGVVWPGPPPADKQVYPASNAGEWPKYWFNQYNIQSTTNETNIAGFKAIRDELDVAVNWSKNHGNIPLWLGEFGAFSGNAGTPTDEASRIRWNQYVREQAEARNIGWAYWELCSGFGIYDKDAKEWRTGLVDALLPTP